MSEPALTAPGTPAADRVAANVIAPDPTAPDPAAPDLAAPDLAAPDLTVRDLIAPARAVATDKTTRRSDRSGPSRALTITLVVSLGLHLAAVAAALLLLHAAPVIDAPGKPTEVELVMEERKGNAQPTASPSEQPTTATPPDQPVRVDKPDPAAAPSPPEQPVEKPADKTPPVQPPTETTAADTPSPPTPSPVEARPDAPKETTEQAKVSDPNPTAATPTAPEAKAAPEPAPPTPPATQTALTITLSGTDSPSNARAWGDRIIPAAPDAVFHNRPPEYPEEAAMNGEHGTVILVIHISPAGTTAGVDVTRSSGYVLLDRAAREAVMRWRFLPAVKDGQPVASDMSMGFVFDY